MGLAWHRRAAFGWWRSSLAAQIPGNGNAPWLDRPVRASSPPLCCLWLAGWLSELLCTRDAAAHLTRCTLDAHSMHTQCTLNAHSTHPAQQSGSSQAAQLSSALCVYGGRAASTCSACLPSAGVQTQPVPGLRPGGGARSTQSTSRDVQRHATRQTAFGQPASGCSDATLSTPPALPAHIGLTPSLTGPRELGCVSAARRVASKRPEALRVELRER
jgi:hypothetical protein